MKIREVYERVKKNRQLEDPQQAYEYMWVIDCDLYDKLYSNSNEEYERPEKYVYGESDDTEVLVPDKYIDAYQFYIYAQDDFDFQDTESYSNNMIMYNALIEELSVEFRKNHREKESKNHIRW